MESLRVPLAVVTVLLDKLEAQSLPSSYGAFHNTYTTR
jgi:hypothetical protein